MLIKDIVNESEQLDEITRPNDLDEARNVLYNAGYVTLGSGGYGEVFYKPNSNSNFVLKLFKSMDTGYMEFIKIAQASNNIHFPVFRGKMMKITNQYYAIRMERLYEMPYTIETDKTTILIWEYVESPNHPMIIERMKKLEETQPGIIEACDILHMALNRLGTDIDLHTGNFMLRGKTIVIIDPFIE